MKQSTRDSYRQSFTRLIDYIHDNLENDLSVDTLAEVAFMSLFHFHRIYRDDWLFSHWLPQSGFEAADFPCFEKYLNDPKETLKSELLTKIHCLLE